MLTSSRASATRLRDRARPAARACRPTGRSPAPSRRSPSRSSGRRRGRPGTAAPRCSRGAEQDADIARAARGPHRGRHAARPGRSRSAPRCAACAASAPSCASSWRARPSTTSTPRRLRAARPRAPAARSGWPPPTSSTSTSTCAARQRARTSSTPPSSRGSRSRAIASRLPGDRVSTAAARASSTTCQEATESTLAILRALARRGIAVIAFGDPDVAANAFRGGEPDALGRLGERARACPASPTLVLEPRAPARTRRCARSPRAVTDAHRHRRGGRPAQASRGARRAHPIRRVRRSRRVARDDAGARVGGDRARAARAAPAARGAVGRARGRRAQRRAGPGDRPGARARRGADPHAPAAASPLRDDPAAARPARARRGRDRPASSSTPAIAAELLLGPFGGLDPIGLRRLRLALRARGARGRRQPGRAASCSSRRSARRRRSRRSTTASRRAPTRLADDPRRAARTRRRTRPSRSCSGSRGSAAASRRPGATRRSASGIAAAEANRNLDGVVALFTAAKRFAERRPDDRRRRLPRRAARRRGAGRPARARAAPTTRCSSRRPSGVVGLEFDTVVVAGLQDGVWPNLRLRGSLLAPQQLVRVVTERRRRRSTSASSCSTTSCGCSRSRSRGRATASCSPPSSTTTRRGSVLFSPACRRRHARARRRIRRRRSRCAGVTGRLRRTLDRPGAPPATERREAAATLAALAAEPGAGRGPGRLARAARRRRPTGPLFDGDAGAGLAVAARDASRSRRSTGSSSTIAGSTSSTRDERRHDRALGDGDRRPTRRRGALGGASRRAGASCVFEAPWLAEQQRRVDARARRRRSPSTCATSRARAASARRGRGRASRSTVDGDAMRAAARSTGSSARRDGAVVIVDLKTGTPDHRRPTSTRIRSSAPTSSPTREGVLDEFLAEHGEHRAGGAKLLFVKEGVGGKALPRGVQAAARRRRARGVPRAHPAGGDRHGGGRASTGVARAAAASDSAPSPDCGCTACGRCPSD